MQDQAVFDSITETIKNLGLKIIGQERLIQRLVIALVCGGHLIVEGAPGLAKTRAIKELADRVEGDFQRIQFTPDLLPSDITGSEIYRPEDGSFSFQQGPIFHNLILADEINRAPAKVQSALLEAMSEGQVSIGRETFDLPELFLVMATQNPIEQEGTYTLPEAQLDRFLMHLLVDYPDSESELKILNLVRNERQAEHTDEPIKPLKNSLVSSARQSVLKLHMSETIEQYIVQLIAATRDTDSDLKQWLDYGASPRGTISLDICARALAWLDGRDYVAPEDIQNVAHDVLRHRLVLSFEAEAQNVTSDNLIDTLIEQVPVP